MIGNMLYNFQGEAGEKIEDFLASNESEENDKRKQI
jgi:hypothetical protein